MPAHGDAHIQVIAVLLHSRDRPLVTLAHVRLDHAEPQRYVATVGRLEASRLVLGAVRVYLVHLFAVEGLHPIDDLSLAPVPNVLQDSPDVRVGFDPISVVDLGAHSSSGGRSHFSSSGLTLCRSPDARSMTLKTSCASAPGLARSSKNPPSYTPEAYAWLASTTAHARSSGLKPTSTTTADGSATSESASISLAHCQPAS